MAMVSATTIVEWPSEKNSPTPTGRRPFLHELARHIVDRGDVVGVESVPQPEAVGEGGRAEQHRIVVEGDDRPEPCGGVDDEQEDVDRR